MFVVGRYHYEQILKRYEQSKPTFTDSNKNIASLSGENNTIILFVTHNLISSWVEVVGLLLKSFEFGDGWSVSALVQIY